MPTTYTPNAANDPTTYTLPSDLDDASAESVNVALRAMADKLAHNYSVFAQLAASNTFTAQQVINDANGFLEIAGNDKWKLMLMGHLGVTDGTQEGELRLYSNNPVLGEPYYGALVCNAYWTGAIWRQQANIVGSTAILFKAAGFDYAYKAPGAADWATWPTGTGDHRVSYLYATNDVLWAAPKTRTMYLAPSQAHGGDFIDSAQGDLTLTGLGYVWWRIQLPANAIVTRVDIKHNQATSTAERFDLVTREPNFGTPSSAPAWNFVSGASASVDASTGYKVSAIVHSTNATTTPELYLLWRPIDAGSTFSSAKVTWTEQGLGRDY